MVYGHITRANKFPLPSLQVITPLGKKMQTEKKNLSETWNSWTVTNLIRSGLRKLQPPHKMYYLEGCYMRTRSLSPTTTLKILISHSESGEMGWARNLSAPPSKVGLFPWASPLLLLKLNIFCFCLVFFGHVF